MNRTSRTAFLDRVAAAVRAGNKYRQGTPVELPHTVGYVGAGPEPVQHLIDELNKLGACAARIHTRAEFGAAIRSLVDRYSLRNAVLNDSGILGSLDLHGLLSDLDVEVTSIEQLVALDEAARRDRLFSIGLGIAAPDWAIAETGTLVYASGPAQTRSATLLPPVHLAIVDTACVLPDLLDLPTQLAGRSAAGGPPSNVTLVTGPSKTGDIELKLTTGVHGPGEVHVLVWQPSGVA